MIERRKDMYILDLMILDFRFQPHRALLILDFKF